MKKCEIVFARRKGLGFFATASLAVKSWQKLEEEVRCIVKVGVSFFGCRHLDCITQRLTAWKKKGVDFIVHTVDENDVLFYRDAIRKLFGRTHELELEVWADPWGVAGLFSGETPSWLLLYQPDVWQKRADGVFVPHACPNNPLTLEALKHWVDFVAAAGADWVLWDEPHWYTPLLGAEYMPQFIEYPKEGNSWVCYCSHCKCKFSERYHKEIPDMLDSTFLSFRTESMIDFLKQITEYASLRGLKNAICCALPSQIETSPPVNEAARLQAVDVIACDPYWFLVNGTIEDYFLPAVEELLTVAQDNNKETQVWLQGFKVPEGREKELLRAAVWLVDRGVSSLAIWHHNEMSVLQPADPCALDSVIETLIKRSKREYRK